MCTWVGFRPSYIKCCSNNLFSIVLSWFDLVITLRWPYKDLEITPLSNPRPTHVTMCTWLQFQPSYMTHSYTTLRVKSPILRSPLVTLSMHRKFADHLKVTWCIVRLKKIYGIQKYPGGVGGFRLSAHGLYENPISSLWFVQNLWTQDICITFLQQRPNVFDVGPTLYECYTNVLRLLVAWLIITVLSMYSICRCTPWGTRVSYDFEIWLDS